MTRSPASRPSRPGPSASTTPATSPDGENGSSRLYLVLAARDEGVEEIQRRRLDRDHASPGSGWGSAMSSMRCPSGPSRLLQRPLSCETSRRQRNPTGTAHAWRRLPRSRRAQAGTLRT